jgi:N-methylhydantoinase A
LPGQRLDGESIPGITRVFEETYRRLYERLSESVPVEIINWRVISSSPAPRVRLRAKENGQVAASTARKGTRRAYFPELGGYVETAVYDRYGLSPGASLSGPAIVEERESTVIVGPDGRFRIDEQLNLIVELQDGLP